MPATHPALSQPPLLVGPMSHIVVAVVMVLNRRMFYAQGHRFLACCIQHCFSEAVMTLFVS